MNSLKQRTQYGIAV